MISWMWRKKWGPIRLLLLVFGVDTSYKNDDEIRHWMVVMPKAAVEAQKLIKTCKRLFDEDQEWASARIAYWSQWKNGNLNVPGWEIANMFRMENLTESEVKEIRNICRKTGHFQITADSLKELEEMISYEAKQKKIRNASKEADKTVRVVGDHLEEEFFG